MNSKKASLDIVDRCALTLYRRVRRIPGLKCWCLIAFFAFAFGARATTYTAASPSSADVQNAINSAHDGDTVLVPQGSATWTTTVTVTPAITLEGAGIGNTVISSSLGPGLDVESDNKGEVRVTGFTFNGRGAETFGPVNLTGNEVRMDDCLFTDCGLFCAISSDGFGVIDHCTFDESDAGLYMQNPSYGGASYGDGSWAAPDNWGTTNFMYIENCVFNGVGQVGAMDGCAGARWVFRHNTVNDDILVAHGADSTGRNQGTRAVEVYDNTFICPGGYAETFELRSGSAVIYSNTCTGYNGNIVCLKNFRSASCNVPGTYPPWGACTGSDPYDGNTDGNGYPAIDQCGHGMGDLMTGSTPTDTVTGKASWPNQASDPVYQWGNLNNGSAAVVGTCSALFDEGRDYFNGVVKAGYTALVYPHPLVSGVSTPSTFTLTVVNGTGSGTFTNNAVVNISATSPGTVTNASFAMWSGSGIANTNLASTTIKMPGSNLTVTAEYVPFPPATLKAAAP
jgi:hypothetical protein